VGFTLPWAGVTPAPGVKNAPRNVCSAARLSSNYSRTKFSLPLFFVELFDLVVARLQVCILDGAVEIDRIAIGFLELVHMQ